MKALKLLLASLVIGIGFNACSVIVDDFDNVNGYTLEELVQSHDLWYIDYNKTTGYGDVPFLSKAFTISFKNGSIYANNNLVGIGSSGNGLGIYVANYQTFNGFLEVDHLIDGYFDFEVVQLSSNQIKLIDNYNNVTYFLEGYQKYNFDYNQIFYDNIEYFLQEYDAWEKTYTSNEGILNAFDSENFLKFTPQDNTTFYSSQDQFGTNIVNLYWDFIGIYKVEDVFGYENLKILTLDYDSWDNEAFELTVINDSKIQLYHLSSETTYEFTGRGYIQYMKSEAGKDAVNNQGRKRTKITRELRYKNN